MEERTADLFIEQYRLGELGNDRLVAELESDPALQQHLEELERSDREILAAYPSGWFADRVRERMAREHLGKRRRRADRGPAWRIVPAVAVAAVALAVIPIVLTTLESDQSAATAALVHGERIKGLEPSLSVYRSAGTGADPEELMPDTAVGAGTHLQLAYQAAGAGYGVIVSVDGNGVVTLHYPETALAEPVLDRGGEIALPFAYVLDDAPRYERFYFLASTEPPDVSAVLRRVEEAVAGDSPVTEALSGYAETLGGSSWVQRFELRKTGD